MSTPIYTAADLNNVRSNLSGDYVQMNDIDLSGYPNWAPIGTGVRPFTGRYDGNYHRVTGLTLSNYTLNNESNGLFGYAIGATLEHVEIVECSVSAFSYAGALVGSATNCTITQCCSSGAVTGYDELGGLIGDLATSEVSECFSTCSVTGQPYSSHYNIPLSIGGLFGEVTGASISNCYAVGSAGGEDTYGSQNLVGGLIGLPSAPVLTNCYSSGHVTPGPYNGGLIGPTTDATINSCYYDKQTSGQDDASGTPETTAAMMEQATFAGWDFVNTWGIHEGTSYPYLLWAVPVPTQVQCKATQLLVSAH